MILPLMVRIVYWLPVAAVTYYHKQGKQIYSLTVVEARSPKSQFRQGWFLLETLVENLFHAFLQLLEATGDPWCSLVYRHIPGTSASVFTWSSRGLPLCVSNPLLLSLLTGTPVIGFKTYPKSRSPS